MLPEAMPEMMHLGEAERGWGLSTCPSPRYLLLKNHPPSPDLHSDVEGGGQSTMCAREGVSLVTNLQTQ